jgi:hypothetical protein
VNCRKLTRTAVIGTAAALCVATATPAFAHGAGNKTNDRDAVVSRVLTVAEVQVAVNRCIDRRLDRLADLAARIAADSDIPADKRAKIAAGIAQEQAALTALKAKITTAATIAEVRQDVVAALAALPGRGWFWWWSRFDPALAHRHWGQHPGLHRNHPGKADPGKADPRATNPARFVPAVRQSPSPAGIRRSDSRVTVRQGRIWQSTHRSSRSHGGHHQARFGGPRGFGGHSDHGGRRR